MQSSTFKLQPKMCHLSFEIGEPRIQLASVTVEFVFAPEEREVFSYEDTQKISLLLGAKPGSGTIAEAGKGAPSELRGKERTAKL